MKKIVVILVFCVLLVGCQQSPVLNSIEVERSQEDVSSSQGKQVKFSDDEIMILRELSIKMALNLEHQEGENFLVSPISYYMALSMLGPMAKEESLDELSAFLKMKDKDGIKDFNQRLIKANEFKEYDNLSQIVNSFWVDQSLEKDKDFLKQMSRDMLASIFEVNFKQPDELKKQMNDWINKQTKGFIKDVDTHVSEDMLASLINTIYFKDRWEHEFDSKKAEMDFRVEDKTVKIPFLRSRIESNDYYQGENYQKISKRFLSGYQVTFILPDSIKEVNQEQLLLNALSHNDYSDVIVDFYVPEFDISANHDLVNFTQKAGLNSVFTNRSKLFLDKQQKVNLKISGIHQQARFKLDREGVEAAAYTQMELKPTAAPMKEKKMIVLKLDKPFYFVLSNSQGIITFIGQVNNPQFQK